MNVFLLATLLATGFSLPESQSADTEVSTNVEISVAGERFAAMHFQFGFVATPTNDLEVLVGYDANVDGDLSPEEAAVTFGYDAGVWFQCETAANRLTESVAPTDGRWLTRDFKFWWNDVDPSWNLAKIVCRGVVPSNERVAVERENKYFRIKVR